MTTFLILTVWMLAAWGVFVLLQRMGADRRSRERLFEGAAKPGAEAETDLLARQGFLERWLFLAGYRHASAAGLFLGAEFLTTTVGVAAVVAFFHMGVIPLMVKSLADVPGGLGDIALPIFYVAPWFLLLVFAGLPWLAVRRVRLQRVEQVEQDLPIALDLLATLSEAGLAFDAGLARLLETKLADRPLAREFRSYQADVLSGRTRVEALRRLSRRVEVASMSILVSALVQAEQLGTGIALVLRRQADDLRSRRRERANAFALTLPVKRMFPLVICFLPGLFVWTLGPAFAQLFQMANILIQRHRF
jgi:pilus assembly protein TadC